MINIPKIAIFVPTFHRPHVAWRVADNVRENTPAGTYELYFIVERDDDATSKEAVKYGRIIINEGKPCYADAINTAYKKTHEPYFFCGADDLGFHKGWSEQATSHMRNGVYVVGTNDLGSIPIGEQRDATHFLVARKYITEQSGVIDRPNTVLHPYHHNYTDKEFVETARMRGVYVYCPKSIVEHFHWAWGKAQMDEIYQKGFRSNAQDEHMYKERQHLWQR